jgi:tetratricopeptide (TPR) repeat protein
MGAVHRTFQLDGVRTDGWFERIGEGIGSFQALCEIVGERFFAFSIIVGARVTALTVDRRSPQQTVVDFVVGGSQNEDDGEPQRLNLADFRRRLVGALLVDEEGAAPPPERETDIEAVQLYIGVRYLLLAPLYGYSLRTLSVDALEGDTILAVHDGDELELELRQFRRRLRNHVHEELERSTQGSRGAIELSRVQDAQVAEGERDWAKIVSLLGSWPAPLAIFLRTPDGQMLAQDGRQMIAKGLAILGTACAKLGELDQAEEVFRIGIQYAHDGAPAADVFARLGEALVEGAREGEAIGPLRRALAVGAKHSVVMPLLARAYLARRRYVAAYAAARHALAAGVAAEDVAGVVGQVESALGEDLMRSWVDALKTA